MARPATGQIVERADATGAIRRSLRFRTGGRRHTVPLGVVSRADAERELAHVIADVERGRDGSRRARSSQPPLSRRRCRRSTSSLWSGGTRTRASSPRAPGWTTAGG